MELNKGFELRIDLEDKAIADYALLLLHLTNMKEVDSLGMVDVRTLSGTDSILVICHEEALDSVKDVAYRHGATIGMEEATEVIEIEYEDFSSKLQKKVDAMLDDDNMPSFYINNTFTKGY